MRILRTMLKIILWPLRLLIKAALLLVIITLTVIQDTCMIAVSFATALFTLLGGIFIICGFLIFLMGLYPATEMWKMVISGTILCLIPMIGEWLTIQITYLTLLAKRWMLT